MHKYEDDCKYRNWVLNNILTGVTSADYFKGRFDKFDIHYLPKGEDKERFMEIKHRNFPHDRYQTTIIEKDKYDAITASTAYIADVDLMIIFEDGWICYTPGRLKSSFQGVSTKYCPDQYDAYGDKWCEKPKEVVEIKIEERWFHKYDQ